MGALARRVLSLGVGEWRQLLRAQWALIVAQRLVRQRPAGQLTKRAASPDVRIQQDRASGEETTTHTQARARAAGDAVRRAAKYGVFRPACLVRAIALQRLLIADGIGGAVIRVGVKQSEEGMLAHAWVELSGEVIGDSREHVGQYTALNDLSVVA